MINKILVATDASAASGRAVSFAAQLAVIHEAELLILNVIRDMQLPDELKNAPEFESFNNTRDDLMRQAADRILDEARKKAKKAGAKKVQTAIGSGDPATSVAGFAKRRKVDRCRHAWPVEDQGCLDGQRVAQAAGPDRRQLCRYPVGLAVIPAQACAARRGS
jgi:nucleotide-binding universal stress UspA family protein